MMKSRILDISDCSESPLLASSKCRRKWARRSPTDLFHVRKACIINPRRNNLISKLTEARLNPESISMLESETMPKAESANISYQARCAERWWAEFSRWFGSLQ